MSTEGGKHCNVSASESFYFDWGPSEVQPSRTYEARAWIVGFEGEVGCGVIALIFLDASGREVRRGICLVDDFSGHAKQYTIRAEAPPTARQALIACRINAELPSDCEPAKANLWLNAPELVTNSTEAKSRAPAVSEAARIRLRSQSGFSPEALQEKIGQVKHWYHRVEVHPGIVTPGVDDPYPLFAQLRLPDDCTGLRVLDVGARDGFFSFAMEQQGAKEVIAIDHAAAEQTGFPVLRELLASKVQFYQENVYNLSAEKHGTFDIVLCLGLLYHLRNPLLALDRLREVCAGKLYVESHVIDHALQNGGVPEEFLAQPIMRFYPRDDLAGDYTNWWGPNCACLRAMLEATNFTILSQDMEGDRAILRCVINDNPAAAYFRRIEKGALLLS